MSPEPPNSGPRADFPAEVDPSPWPALAARIRQGDARAFETVFRRYSLPLLRYAHRQTGSPEVAADLIHDVFLKIWAGRASWRLETSLQAYLYRAVRNTVYDFLKHRRIERRLERTDHDTQANYSPTPAPSPALLAERRDLTARLEHALAQLPERRRQVFLLRWKDDLSYREIAELMGVTVKTVENQMNHALRALRQALGDR